MATRSVAVQGWKLPGCFLCLPRLLILFHILVNGSQVCVGSRKLRVCPRCFLRGDERGGWGLTRAICRFSVGSLHQSISHIQAALSFAIKTILRTRTHTLYDLMALSVSPRLLCAPARWK